MTYIRTIDMVFHMKTTLIIDDSVMLRLKQESVRRGKTISLLVESALRMLLGRLDEGDSPRSQEMPPLPSFHGGRPLVDLADRDALYRAMEGR